MRKITFLLCLLYFGMCLGQHTGTNDCDYQADNKAWMLKYKNAESKSEKINLVVEKIIQDGYALSDNSETADLGSAKILDKDVCSSKCMIRFGLIYEKKKGLVLDLKRNPEFEELIMEFNEGNISNMELNEYHEKNIYSAAMKRSGIVLYTNDKALQKMIKKALKKSNK